MPFKSQAQAGYFFSHKAELEKQGVDVDEWAQASKGLKLPRRAPNPPSNKLLSMVKAKG